MLITPHDTRYINAAIQMIDEGKIEPTLDCPECDETIDEHDGNHIVYQRGWGSRGQIPLAPPVLLICCEGYHMHGDAVKANTQ